MLFRKTVLQVHVVKPGHGRAEFGHAGRVHSGVEADVLVRLDGLPVAMVVQDVSRAHASRRDVSVRRSEFDENRAGRRMYCFGPEPHPGQSREAKAS